MILNSIVLYRADEITGFPEMANRLQNRFEIYGSALNGNDMKFKISLYRRRQSEVVAIGSSRMMQFREEAFRASFTNCGGVFSSLEHGEAFIDNLLKSDHLPQTALVGVDYWWFHKDYVGPPSQVLTMSTREDILTRQKLLAPFEWAFADKLSAGMYAGLLISGRIENPTARFPTTGVYAMRTSSGWRPDGSYLNTNAAFKTEQDYVTIRADLADIRVGKVERINLGVGDFVDPSRLDRFVRILRKLRDAGVKLVVMMPPVMFSYRAAAGESAGNRSYIAPLATDLKTRSLAEGFEFYDFTALEADDCEFLDGWHPGEIANLRVLQSIAGRANSVLNSVVDLHRVADGLRNGTGKSLWVLDGEKEMFKKTEYCAAL